jgi:hypothetical protein
MQPQYFSLNTYYTGGRMWRRRRREQVDMAYVRLVVF